MRLRLINKRNLIIMLTVAMVGCKKLDLTPLNKYNDDNFWQVNANAFNALATCYQQQISGGYSDKPGNYPASSSAQAYFYNEALSDNAYCPLDPNVGTPTQISSGVDANFNSGINRVKYEWGSYYANIRSCNLFLENIDKNTTLGAALITRMKGEARYLRAHALFRLTNFFGDVPLVTKVLTPDEAKSVARTPKADVITYVLNELDAAAAILPRKEDLANADRGRITKGAAKAMKARVLLYNNRWAECAAVCEDLMNNQAVNGAYSLQPVFSDVFSATNKYNSEVIADLGYQPVARTFNDWQNLGPLYTGVKGFASPQSNLVPTQDLVESYLTLDGKGISEPGSGYQEDIAPYANRDPRLGFTVVYDKYQWVNNLGNTQTIYIKPGSAPDASNKKNEVGVGSQSGYYWRKYYDPTADASFNSGENIIIMRWADVLLMEAEARQMAGTFDATVWNNTIKLLRARAGFVNPLALNYPGNTTMSMTDQIRNERRCEMALESQRYDDIKRWRIAEVVLNRPSANQVRGAKFASNNTDFLRLGVRLFNPAKHYLWPIPLETIQTDPAITQNPGWQ